MYTVLFSKTLFPSWGFSDQTKLCVCVCTFPRTDAHHIQLKAKSNLTDISFFRVKLWKKKNRGHIFYFEQFRYYKIFYLVVEN